MVRTQERIELEGGIGQQVHTGRSAYICGLGHVYIEADRYSEVVEESVQQVDKLETHLTQATPPLVGKAGYL